MATTFNYFMTVWQKAKINLINNPFVVLISLVLLTIPLHYRYNSVALMLFLAYSLFALKSNKFQFNKILLIPIILYFLFVLSLFWSIDFDVSANALSKSLPLFLIPIAFFLNPIKNEFQKLQILNFYAFGIFGFALFYIVKAGVRFLISHDSAVFFYHELVTFDVNAIHVSVFVAIAFFVFYIKSNKRKIDYFAQIVLFILLILLSSKNIIVIFLSLLIAQRIFFSKQKMHRKYIYVTVVLVSIISISLFGKIKERFLIEYDSNASETSINTTIPSQQRHVFNVSIKDAWNKEVFQPNDFFPGTALRVYQFRIFIEMLKTDNIFFTGYGANATRKKIIEKRIEHNLYIDYENFNFHNEYIQVFAELGIFGFLLLLTMLGLNLKSAIKKQDFIHFSFAILMISLFLTESFLSRARGLVFFTLMYCIFNALKNNKKIENKLS